MVSVFFCLYKVGKSANTFKRVPKFTTNQYIANKRSAALRCEANDRCNPKAPDCWDNCVGGPRQRYGKSTTTTQDLGFISSQQMINRRLALRAGGGKTNAFESKMMNNNNCNNIN